VHPLEFLFHPRSVAIAGASPDLHSQSHDYLDELQQFGYSGDVYLVNPRYQEIDGLPCYPSLREIPGPVDYVISCVPASALLALVDDAIAKGVRALHMYTARLSESGLPERQALEAEIAQRAKQAGLRLIGPNCMGIYYPQGGLTFRHALPRDPGTVGVLSQSGGNSADLEYRGVGRGLRFSKMVSYGNAEDINEADLMDYFADDPQTRVIGAYIEGPKDGKRFFQALRRAAATKPVAIVKGGATATGQRAISTHTASLAGQDRVWDALCRQTGAVRVTNLEELADLLIAFSMLPPCSGNRVAVLGGGGGYSVYTSDAAERAGLVVPPLPQAIKQRLKEVVPQVWSLISNPVDHSVLTDPSTYLSVAGLVAGHPSTDLVLFNLDPAWYMDTPRGIPRVLSSVEGLLKIARECGKPAAVAVVYSDSLESWRWETTAEVQRRCVAAGLPVFLSIDRAVKALSYYVGYYRSVERRRET